MGVTFKSVACKDPLTSIHVTFRKAIKVSGRHMSFGYVRFCANAGVRLAHGVM